ncbi:MAG: efflux RND transporter permease subunit [Methyloprofundus sp.]|nr:efflux RND transporter permease subunit [Methyloprofundus sp.]
MFSKFFIERPIFAAVISIVLLIAGSVSLLTLPTAQYPEITPPYSSGYSDLPWR